jgi:arylsulfatase A-like enzyme
MATHHRGTLTRRRFVQSTAAGSLALAGIGGVGQAQAARPNILFIMADDLGYADVSCYGARDYTTPNVDRLALEGLRFRQAYSNSANCSPTRTALITGRYQMRLPLGLEEPLGDTAPPGIGLPPSHPTLPSILKKAGYGTTLVGKWHLGYLPDFSRSRAATTTSSEFSAAMPTISITAASRQCRSTSRRCRSIASAI